MHQVETVIVSITVNKNFILKNLKKNKTCCSSDRQHALRTDNYSMERQCKEKKYTITKFYSFELNSN